MDVLVHVVRHVDVDDVSDCLNGKVAVTHSRAHDNFCYPVLQSLQSFFALALPPVAMNGGRWVPLFIKY